MLPDGIGCSVRVPLYRSMKIFRPPLNPRYSTGSFCIVRTVLNGGSVPDDFTCALPVPNYLDTWLTFSNR